MGRCRLLRCAGQEFCKRRSVNVESTRVKEPAGAVRLSFSEPNNTVELILKVRSASSIQLCRALI